MPTFYEGDAIAEFENPVSEEEYALAWRLFQEKQGSLRQKELFSLLFALAAVASLLYLPTYSAKYATFWIPILIVALCLLGIVWQQVLLPGRVKRRGMETYRSNRLLSLPARVRLYRDSYQERNQYERIEGHWTDMSGCVEGNTLFVVTGGWDRSLLVIPKKNLSEEQVRRVSDHFQNTFVKKYSRIQK